jgi:hypothetical protein
MHFSLKLISQLNLSVKRNKRYIATYTPLISYLKQTHMKKLILIILLLSFRNITGNAQLRNEIIVSSGFINNDLIMDDRIVGDMGFIGRKTNNFEIGYQRSFNNTISFETGFAYTNSKLIYQYFPTGVLYSEEKEIKLLSVPCGISFNFLKYFFINTGTTIDIESGRTSGQVTHDQSGLGFYAGLGAKYYIRNFSLKINPFFMEHAVIPFGEQSYKERLWEEGVKIGIGYRF